MTISTLALAAPMDLTTWAHHPALAFYGKYGKDFSENMTTIPPEKYYNANCKMTLVDGSVLTGADRLWTFFQSLYLPFEKTTREILTVTVVSDDSAGTHRIHTELITTLHPGSGRPAVAVPQAFVYVLGKADEGKGTDGLQFMELRNYYDFSLVEKARAKD